MFKFCRGHIGIIPTQTASITDGKAVRQTDNRQTGTQQLLVVQFVSIQRTGSIEQSVEL